MNTFLATSVTILTAVGFKLIGAVAIWIVGRWVIGLTGKVVGRALNRQHLDPTVVNYIRVAVGVGLNVGLAVAILGFLGVETTSFAALVAGIGLAIGAAWSGLLSNFAAGFFLIILRPFRVGDFVTIAGVTGTVHTIGLFGTDLDTPDNVRTSVGNSKVLADTIQNFSSNPFRRVDLLAQLSAGVNPEQAIAVLKTALPAIPNVVAAPAPDVEILTFSDMGPVLAVRPYCHNDHYWQVYFDTNKLIADAFGAAGFPAPEHPHSVRTLTASAGV